MIGQLGDNPEGISGRWRAKGHQGCLDMAGKRTKTKTAISAVPIHPPSGPNARMEKGEQDRTVYNTIDEMCEWRRRQGIFSSLSGRFKQARKKKRAKSVEVGRDWVNLHPPAFPHLQTFCSFLCSTAKHSCAPNSISYLIFPQLFLLLLFFGLAFDCIPVRPRKKIIITLLALLCSRLRRFTFHATPSFADSFTDTLCPLNLCRPFGSLLPAFSIARFLMQFLESSCWARRTIVRQSLNRDPYSSQPHH